MEEGGGGLRWGGGPAAAAEGRVVLPPNDVLTYALSSTYTWSVERAPSPIPTDHATSATHQLIHSTTTATITHCIGHRRDRVDRLICISLEYHGPYPKEKYSIGTSAGQASRAGSRDSPRHAGVLFHERK